MQLEDRFYTSTEVAEILGVSLRSVYRYLEDGKLIEDPLWLKKFKVWGSLQKTCPAARGPTGIYCSWEGRNCSYNMCPRRIFEEVIIDPDKIQQPKPPQKLKTQIATLQKEKNQLKKQVATLTTEIEDFKKKFAELGKKVIT